LCLDSGDKRFVSRLRRQAVAVLLVETRFCEQVLALTRNFVYFLRQYTSFAPAEWPGNSSNSMDGLHPRSRTPPAVALPSSTSASAPSPAPPSNPPSSAAFAAPSFDSTITTPTPTLSPGTVANPRGTVANPAQTLEAPAARPPPPRMRPPYAHLASPITMSSSSSAATAATSSSFSVPPSSSTAPLCQGLVLGVPAPRPAQMPVGYTGFVPPPPFGSMHRDPDQPPPSSSQVCMYSWLIYFYASTTYSRVVEM
jgi:hypothetical protein